MTPLLTRVRDALDGLPADASTSNDLLSMERINSLPHPLQVRLFGAKEQWPVHDIDVETGLMRFDVCGMPQVGRFGSVAELIDGNGDRHDSDLFYSDAPPVTP